MVKCRDVSKYVWGSSFNAAAVGQSSIKTFRNFSKGGGGRVLIKISWLLWLVCCLPIATVRWLCERCKGMEEGCVSSRLISWGRIGDGSRSVIVPKTVQYTSAFSSKEAFVIRNPLLCEFPKLNPFIMATARGGGGGREKHKMSKSGSQVGRVKWIYKLQLQWTRISPPESLNFGKYEGWIDR